MHHHSGSWFHWAPYVQYWHSFLDSALQAWRVQNTTDNLNPRHSPSQVQISSQISRALVQPNNDPLGTIVCCVILACRFWLLSATSAIISLPSYHLPGNAWHFQSIIVSLPVLSLLKCLYKNYTSLLLKWDLWIKWHIRFKLPSWIKHILFLKHKQKIQKICQDINTC